MKQGCLYIRASLFWVGLTLVTLLYGVLLPFLLLFSYERRYPVLVAWGGFGVWWLKFTCNVRYQVLGLENIPKDQAFIVMSNHQSTFETFVLPQVLPPLTWVLKKELLKIPLFGLGLKMIKPVAIDRSTGKTAVLQVKEQGTARLNEGICIVIFPEGTRVVPGQCLRYRIGGGVLATSSEYPVLPIAHNSGESWPRHSFIKKPGLITLSIGPTIQSEGLEPEQLMRQVEQWIEHERKQLVFKDGV